MFALSAAPHCMTKTVAALASLTALLAATTAQALTIVATPGEQNTQSGENGCAAEPCPQQHPTWLHYPELLAVALGAGYQVMQNGDGGAVLGCDAASKTLAGNQSFCASSKYNDSIKGPPNIAIIGPFGEHDQRIISGASAQDKTTFYTEAAFEAAYEGLVQDYLKLNAKVIMMTPIDVPFNAGALGAGQNIVKDLMLPAATKVAQSHSLKLVDTYSVITSAMYNGSDGQVNKAGQQKMADLVLAAIMDNGAAGSGGAGGAAGAAGSGGGSAGASGGGGAATQGGASGSAMGGTAAGGAGAGSGGTPLSTAGNASAGTGGSATGGSSTFATTPPASDSSCAFGGPNGSAAGTSLAALALAFALARRRKSA
jgi:hypothetical protein